MRIVIRIKSRLEIMFKKILQEYEDEDEEKEEEEEEEEGGG